MSFDLSDNSSDDDHNGDYGRVDILAAFVDRDDDDEEQEEDTDSQKWVLENFFDDNANFVPLSSKIPFIIRTAQSLPNPSDLKKEPYSNKLFNKKKVSYTPTKFKLTLEWQQRTEKEKLTKYLTKEKIISDEFKEHPLDEKDTNFVKANMLEHKKLLEKVITKYHKENPLAAHFCLNTDNWLWFIAIFLDNWVKKGYCTTQETLN